MRLRSITVQFEDHEGWEVDLQWESGAVANDGRQWALDGRWIASTPELGVVRELLERFGESR